MNKFSTSTRAKLWSRKVRNKNAPDKRTKIKSVIRQEARRAGLNIELVKKSVRRFLIKKTTMPMSEAVMSQGFKFIKKH